MLFFGIDLDGDGSKDIFVGGSRPLKQLTGPRPTYFSFLTLHEGELGTRFQHIALCAVWVFIWSVSAGFAMYCHHTLEYKYIPGERLRFVDRLDQYYGPYASDIFMGALPAIGILLSILSCRGKLWQISECEKISEREKSRIASKRTIREEAAFQAQQQASLQAELRESRDRQGFVVRLQTAFPAIASLGIFASIAVFANEAWRMSQWAGETDVSEFNGLWDAVQQFSEADPGSAARAWQAIALAVFFSLLSSSVVAKSHRLAVALGFGIAAGGMIFFSMPTWVWMFPATVAVSELFSKGGILRVISGDEQEYRQVFAVAGGWVSALAGGIAALLKADAEDEHVGNATKPDLWYVRKGGDGGKIRRVTRSELVAAAKAGKLKTHYELSRSPGGPFRPVAQYLRPNLRRVDQ